MLQDEIYKIYGTNHKKMTLDILDKADLKEEIERKAKNLGVDDAKTLKIGLKPNLVCASPAQFWRHNPHRGYGGNNRIFATERFQ